MTTTEQRRSAEEYFGEDAKKRLLDDRDQLRRDIDPWRRRVKKFDDMVYPQLTDNSPASKLMKSDQEIERQKRARYISNTIRTGCDTIINRFELGEPIFEVGLATNPSKEQQQQTALVERFLHGILNYLDHAVIQSRMGSGWKHQVYTNAIMPSKLIGMAHYMDTGEFRADLYDPINCYMDIGKDPLRFIHEYVTTARGAVALLETEGLPVTAELAETVRTKPETGTYITEHWLNWPVGENGEHEIWRSLLVGDLLVSSPRKTAFKRLPITVVSINTMGRTYQDVGMGGEALQTTSAIAPDYWLRHAEPWFASLEHTIGQYEEGKSLEMLALGLLVRPVRQAQSEHGDWRPTTEELNTPGNILSVTPDQVLREPVSQANPLVANTILASLETDIENAFPKGLRGQVPFAGASGFFYNTLIDQSNIMTVPYARGTAIFMELLMQELVQQFREAKSTVKLIVQTRNRNQPQGKFFYEDFSSEDIPESIVIRVKLAPMLPHDDLRTSNIFIQSTSSGMISKQSAMSRAGVEDPLGEMALIKQEQADANPLNQQRRALKAVRDELTAIRAEWKRAQRNGEDELAQELEIDLRVQTLQYHALEAKLLGGPLPPFQQPNPQGVPPEVNPPEAGPNNPDQAAFAEGRAPYTGGRPPRALLGAGG